jgi:hypothetical protein
MSIYGGEHLAGVKSAPVFFLPISKMRAFLLTLFFAGIVLIVVNQLVKANAQPPRVEYRYLPRDLDTYLREQPEASTHFGAMFRDEDARWGR